MITLNFTTYYNFDLHFRYRRPHQTAHHHSYQFLLRQSLHLEFTRLAANLRSSWYRRQPRFGAQRCCQRRYLQLLWSISFHKHRKMDSHMNLISEYHFQDHFPSFYRRPNSLFRSYWAFKFAHRRAWSWSALLPRARSNPIVQWTICVSSLPSSQI